jgi:hypothetical protein
MIIYNKKKFLGGNFICMVLKMQIIKPLYLLVDAFGVLYPLLEFYKTHSKEYKKDRSSSGREQFIENY